MIIIFYCRKNGLSIYMSKNFVWFRMDTFFIATHSVKEARIIVSTSIQFGNYVP